jgi:hypothetical protein
VLRDDDAVDWDSKACHTKFIESPAYGPFKEKIASLLEAEYLHHVELTPFPAGLLGHAPVTEGSYSRVLPFFPSYYSRRCLSSCET